MPSQAQQTGPTTTRIAMRAGGQSSRRERASDSELPAERSACWASTEISNLYLNSRKAMSVRRKNVLHRIHRNIVYPEVRPCIRAIARHPNPNLRVREFPIVAEGDWIPTPAPTSSPGRLLAHTDPERSHALHCAVWVLRRVRKERDEDDGRRTRILAPVFCPAMTDAIQQYAPGVPPTLRTLNVNAYSVLGQRVIC